MSRTEMMSSFGSQDDEFERLKKECQRMRDENVRLRIQLKKTIKVDLSDQETFERACRLRIKLEAQCLEEGFKFGQISTLRKKGRK